MIYSYIYSSKTNKAFTLEELLVLQKEAATKNKEHDVTGYLTFKNDIFFQYIEGPEKEIKQLIKNIENDHRHGISNSFILPVREERVFGGWSMRYIDFNSLVEIGFHELLETVFFTIDNQLFSNQEVAKKINRMLLKIADNIND
ncbi:BLUF domain-containing protein [Flammeovirga pacifica]|uniref:BLUF domain-containing protein n=1 Tax=Flammeovirga pacifica TaxID=915059 RepID=A0A1S1YYR8_FLAPC|nr:BLUF domain-containing protein [Flammeovirga pacifica]OHX66147.1 hypothetical protein NH26_07180 [Flammeovirga pacifica]